MRIREGDTVLVGNRRDIAIVERRTGWGHLVVRYPADGNRREEASRADLTPLAQAMFDARSAGTKYRHGLSLTGDSTLAELVAEFGYSTAGRLRSDSTDKVIRQLERAGLSVECDSDRWGRDDRFSLRVAASSQNRENSDDEVLTLDQSDDPGNQIATICDPFWPTVLGLEATDELSFLRSLMMPDPVLCLLHMPDDRGIHAWLRPTWEGIISWAFRGAQRFMCKPHMSDDPAFREVVVGSGAMLQTYFGMCRLSDEMPQLQDKPHSLNLISLRSEAEVPVEFERLRAIWPGCVFEFRPQLSQFVSDTAPLTDDSRALLECLFLVGGCRPDIKSCLSPLKTLLWARHSFTGMLAEDGASLADDLGDRPMKQFKGGNESSTSLCLKAHLLRWVRSELPASGVTFEAQAVDAVQSESCDDELGARYRFDAVVSNAGRFEIESMIQSGPMEDFYHKKVLSRATARDSHFHLIVPNDAILWAGRYLADLAHRLGDKGKVLVQKRGGGYWQLAGHQLDAWDQSRSYEVPTDQLVLEAARTGAGQNGLCAEEILKLSDVAGYHGIRERVEELIIWPERHRRLVRGTSRSSGMLFFGPPGCGKSRLARAIAGELEQEVRLVGPSDLRGAYVGWGQILIREQFDWVSENERRMLVIDELDAVARSRRVSNNMHEDTKANVNELLVQLDRVCRLGRLVVGTTNYIASLDDAVLRSGRFGRFIPVPPPDVNESLDILGYYLRRLSHIDGTNLQPHVEVPDTTQLRSAVESAFENVDTRHGWYCCADLEEAVNRTYLRCLRKTVAGVDWTSGAQQYSRLRVELTAQELVRSLLEVPRSIGPRAMRTFLREVSRFCSRSAADQIRSAFVT